MNRSEKDENLPAVSESSLSYSQRTDKIFLRDGYEVRLRVARRISFSGANNLLFNLIFPLDGKLNWRAGERSGEIEAGGALFVAPGEATNFAGGRVTLIMLSLQPAFVLDCAVRARVTRTEAELNFRAATTAGDERLAQLAHVLADEMLDDDADGRELSIHAIIEQMMVHLLRRYMNVRRSSDLEMSRVGPVDRRIRRAVEMMHAHLEREITLDELASVAYLSPFHFARLFKKLMGASPHAYLAALRVRRAQSLLAETDLSITEIAARVGYASSSHFAKSFRQTTGLTPRAFRASLVRV